MELDLEELTLIDHALDLLEDRHTNDEPSGVRADDTQHMDWYNDQVKIVDLHRKIKRVKEGKSCKRCGEPSGSRRVIRLQMGGWMHYTCWVAALDEVR